MSPEQISGWPMELHPFHCLTLHIALSTLHLQMTTTFDLIAPCHTPLGLRSIQAMSAPGQEVIQVVHHHTNELSTAKVGETC